VEARKKFEISFEKKDEEFKKILETYFKE